MTNTAAAIATETGYETLHGKTLPLPAQIVSEKINRTLPPARLLTLLHAVEKNMEAASGAPTILFMSPHENTNADIVAFESAYAGALSGKRVLFINTHENGSEITRRLQNKVPAALNVPRKDDIDGIASFVNVQGTSLFYAVFKGYKEHHTFFADSRAHEDIIDKLRQDFDLIVIYSQSGLSNPLTTILSGLADASVIIAEEGRTRIPVVKNLRHRIEMHGGHVAGVVLNKCRFHIPPFVYKAFFSF
jgi:Mrp family chromosome partitioning ATPase